MKLTKIQSIESGVKETPIKSRKLSPTAASLLAERDNRGLPIWVRAPVHGGEYYSSVSRAKLYELASKGLIRTASLREPGQIKGTRLFDLQSVLNYIEKNKVEPTFNLSDAILGDQHTEENNPAGR